MLEAVKVSVSPLPEEGAVIEVPVVVAWEARLVESACNADSSVGKLSGLEARRGVLKVNPPLFSTMGGDPTNTLPSAVPPLVVVSPPPTTSAVAVLVTAWEESAV